MIELSFLVIFKALHKKIQTQVPLQQESVYFSQKKRKDSVLYSKIKW